MSLLNPIGLLGLLSILILIIIYILKPRYQQKKISSTFIWKLSLKYKKRKLPLRWLQKSLLFIMQLMILVLLTLLWTKPAFIFSLENGEKVIILDASSSMLTKSNNVTRFDRALNEIKEMVERKKETDKITIIFADNEPYFVVRREISPVIINEAIEKLNCTFEAADIEKALTLANSVLDENVYADVFLLSDKQYQDTGYVTLIDMSKKEWNAAILDFKAELVNGYYTFKAEIASFNKDEFLSVDLYIDDIKQTTKIANCKNNLINVITWDDVNIISYDTAYIKITANDSFPYDNEFYLFGGNRQELKVQLVSPSPIFLFSMLRPMGCLIDVHYTYDVDNFENIKYSGYDLYIFDSFELTTLPKDGAVWIINPLGDLPNELNLDLGASVNNDSNASFPINNDSDIFFILTKDFNPQDLLVTKYTKLNNYDDYEEVVMVNNDPLIITRKINKVKVVVFAFDFAYSNLPILFVDYTALVRNIKGYLIAHTTEKLLYHAGEVAMINAKPDSSNLYLEYEGYFNVFKDTPIKHELKTPGIYKVTQKFDDKLDQVEKFYVRVHKEESNFAEVGGILAGKEYINLEKGIVGGSKNKNNFQDIITYIAGAVLVLLVIEWGLQYREFF